MPDRPRYIAAAPPPDLLDAGGVTAFASTLAPCDLSDLHFDERGLIPAIVQDAATGDVLMLAYMNQRSLALTFATGQTHFWSRSRGELWHKGGTSGNVQHVSEVRVDCDGDTLLVRVHPAGPACHTGETSCFFRTLQGVILEPSGVGEPEA